MTWHPAIGSPDPASAWVTDEQLEEHRAHEKSARAFEHMLERRHRFEADVARATDPTTTELADMWRAADQETE